MRLSTTEIRFLTLQEKVQYIRRKGVFEHIRREKNYQVHVYLVGTYEAELWMRRANSQIEKVIIKDK